MGSKASAASLMDATGGSVHSSTVVDAVALGTRSCKSGKHGSSVDTQSSSSSSLVSLSLDTQQGGAGELGLLSELRGGNHYEVQGDVLLPISGAEVGVEPVEALSRGVATAAIASSETAVTIPTKKTTSITTPGTTSTTKKPIRQRGVDRVRGMMMDNDTHSVTAAISNENGNRNENANGNNDYGVGSVPCPPSIGNDGKSPAISTNTEQNNSKSRRR